MKFFNVLNIIREGEINDPASEMGAGEELFDISFIGLEKHHGNDTHYIVGVSYERKINGKSLFNIKVTTTWLINGLESTEFGLLQMLVARSVSHLVGHLSCTFQDNKWMMMLPHGDPNFNRAFELSKEAFNKFFEIK